MLRLIGILTGSAIAIGVLIIALGVPQLPPEQEPNSGTVTLSRQDTGSGTVTVSPENLTVIQVPETIDVPPQNEVAERPEDKVTVPDLADDADKVTVPETVAEENWYAFWSPFRSELAANGFIAKLQQTTGIDYRVVKVRTGVYEVAFAYSDDADIQDKLARIAGATGLDLSDG